MLVQSKSNLARLMAAENLLVEQRNVNTASFDLKSRILTVPMLNGNLSPYLYDLLLGHEVGHALETPEIGWHNSIMELGVNKSILNVCEDVRIEKKIKRKFPGIRISFLKGYEELLNMDFFQTKGKDLNTYNLVDRINLYCKIGPAHGIEFSDEETVLLNDALNTETFEEVVEVARKIQEFLKETVREEQRQEEVRKLIVEITDEAPDENASSEEINPDDYDEIEYVDKRTGKDAQTATTIESLTDQAFREKETSLYDNKGTDILYTNIPDVILEKIIVDYKELYPKILSYKSSRFNMTKMKSNFNKFRLESNKVVSYLVKEFELHKNAQQSNKGQTSKTGDLDMSKLQNYKFSEDMFMRITKIPNGKSHGLVMFVDWSGSMASHLQATIKQLLNLVMFCKKVCIPFEVYAFSSYSRNMMENSFVPSVIQEKKIGDAVLGNLSLLNLLSSKMNSRDFSDASAILLEYGTQYGLSKTFVVPDFFHLGGTPLNEAVVAAFKLVPEFQKKNNLEIVNTVFLTDGEGTSLSRRYDYVDVYNHHKEESHYPSSKKRVFFRDTVTKATAETYCIEHSASQTKALLTLLKQRLQCNLIGFYVCSARDAHSVLQMYGSKNVETKYENFKKNNYTQMDDAGYDQYYILKSSSLNIEDGELEVSGNSTRSLFSAFNKYTGNKITNRVVLNQFIKLIA